MGIRQDHDKVMKLHVVQTLHSMIPYRERAEYASMVENAHRHILGPQWSASGLSLESSEGLAHYLRGAYSKQGQPMHLNHGNLMRGVLRDLLSLESRLELINPNTLSGSIALGQLGDSFPRLKRFGLDKLSLESDEPTVWKNLVKMIGGLFSGKYTAKEEPFDYNKVDWSTVHKMGAVIEKDVALLQHTEKEPIQGKISGEGIVKNLSWGSEFDEKDPVAFIKKKFSEWDKFYHAHEAAVVKLSQAVLHDEKTTRAAAKAAGDDVEKIEAILAKAIKTLLPVGAAVANIAVKMNPTFPGGRVVKVSKPGQHNVYGALDSVKKEDVKDHDVRALTGEEARALLTWLKDTVNNLKKYTTLFDKARFSDHSDGDEFWDLTEQCHNEYEYSSCVYWQSIDSDLVNGVDDISVILATLSKGIMTWVDRSFPNR